MKRITSVILTTALLSSLTVNAFGARTKADVEKEQRQSEKNLEAAEAEASEISGEQKAAEAEVSESEERLANIIASVSIIEDEIKDKTKAAEDAKVEYDEAKKREEVIIFLVFYVTEMYMVVM